MLEIMVTSSLLIIALAILRRLLQKKISRRLQYALWLMVALRLLVPVEMFENPFNVMNILQTAAQGNDFHGYGSMGTGRVVYDASRVEEKENRGQENALVRTENASLTDSRNEIFVEGRKGSEDLENITAPEVGGGDADRTVAAGELGLKAQERILEGGFGLARFFTDGFWRYVWYGGILVIGLWMIVCNVVFRRKISRNRTALGREGGLRVYMAEGIGSPCLLGVLRPAVYLARDSAQNTRHREHAVLHELTHYRHGDHVWVLVRSLCLIIYWFDPLVWLAVYLSAKDCEMACDEDIVYRLGEAHSLEYGCTLIEMAASGGRGEGLFRCAPGFSVRKKELKDRISRIAAGKRHTGILVAVLVAACGILLAACTFGGVKKEAEMGRYVETVVELPGQNREYYGLAQDGEAIRLVAAAGWLDEMSVDGTVDFEVVDYRDIPQRTLELYERHPLRAAGSVNGARIYLRLEGDEYTNLGASFGTYLITEAREEIKLDALGDDPACFFYSGGYFWVSVLQDAGMMRFYKLDPSTGEMQFLVEGPYYAYYMAADERFLYLVEETGVQLFDLDECAFCQEQDQVLSDFVAGKYTYAEDFPVMLYPWRDGVYLLTHQGLYWHGLYDDTVEMVIDGGYCSMGVTGKTFAGLAIRETEGEPEFFLLYQEGELMHYTYDASLPSVPDALRVYSVYEDSQVAIAVNTFRTQHPDIPVVYEVGMNAVYGATLDDVLKNLATEIAAGNGPDILVMDDIPFDSYAEKGVLADLSLLRESMTQENYFVNVVDAFVREEKLYAIPMTFAVPVLAGREGILEGLENLESLEDLADLLEQERKVSQGDYVFCTWDAESTLRLLAQSSQGAWLREGTLDLEAVEEFLAQAKRIYDIQFSAAGEPNGFRYAIAHDFLDPTLWMGDYRAYPLARRFDSDGLYCMLDKAKWAFEDDNICYAGFMGGGERDFMLIQGVQKVHGDTYVRMPGQQYGTCLASSLLAVNAGTDRPEESLLFLKYAVSCEFLSERELRELNGTPISREAYLAKQKTKGIQNDNEECYTLWLDFTHTTGKEFEYTIDWPEAEDYDRLTEMLDGVTGVNICDTVVYETVVEYGRAVLAGEMGIQEAMEAIEKRVKIYLAE